MGICGYNKIFFGPSMDVKATMEPEYDESKRTVTYYVIHFTFDWWVDCDSGAEPSPTDATTSVDKQMEQIRTALMTPGADFQFLGRPGADLGQPRPHQSGRAGRVGLPRRGEAVGPRVGAEAAADDVGMHERQGGPLHVSIDVALFEMPQRTGASETAGVQLLAELSIQAGYTSRTYRGFIRIPGVRGPNGSRAFLQDNADAYLDGVMPSVPAGFERTKYERTLSYNKCRLDFTVVDEQYPSGNYPQKNMVKAEASHTVSSPGPAFNPWSGAFDGAYEYARGINPGLGFAAFQALDRLDALAKEGERPRRQTPGHHPHAGRR